MLARVSRELRRWTTSRGRPPNRVEFTGGLEALALQDYQVDLLAGLRPRPNCFFAYDPGDAFETLEGAARRLLEAGFTRQSHRLRCYVLIGYPKDTYDSATERLTAIAGIGFTPMAMLWRPETASQERHRPDAGWRAFSTPVGAPGHHSRKRIAFVKLKLAEGLSLPIDAVTQTIAILAKRRAGKSYTMRRLTEQLLHAGQQVVIVDPKGDQWGLRSAADGKAPGLPIVILGGERGDVPLEASSGEVVAKLVVEDRVRVLLDLSLFRKHEVATFMTAFLENLYRLKAREMYRTPMMLVVDEADAVAPQKPQKGEERMLGAAEDIVRRGGQRGIGCVLVTQRSAVLNKNVLTQAQVLIALRTIAPQDLAAMNAWIDVHGTPEQRKTLMESLPSLPVGDAWVWSPGWPTVDGIFKRVHVLPIETFDSGASPKPGVKPVEPKNLADVDLDALKGQMAATIEKAKADDPRELRKQIVELKRQVASEQKRVGTKTVPETTKAANAELKAELGKYRRALESAMKILVKIRAVDFDVSTEDGQKLLEQAVAAAVKQVTAPIEKRVTALATRVEGFKLAAKHAEAEIAKLLGETINLTVQVEKREPFQVAADKPRQSRPPAGPRELPDGFTLTGPQQRILNALFWAESVGLPNQRREKVGFLADASPKSSAFMNNLGALRTAGLIDYPTQGFVSLTDKGRAAAQTDGNVPNTSAELQAAICAKLPAPQARIVQAVVRAYPSALDRQAVAEQAEASPASSAFMNNLGALRSLGLLDYPQQGMVAAAPTLFLEER
jgi:hypothetical protein